MSALSLYPLFPFSLETHSSHLLPVRGEGHHTKRECSTKTRPRAMLWAICTSPDPSVDMLGFASACTMPEKDDSSISERTTWTREEESRGGRHSKWRAVPKWRPSPQRSSSTGSYFAHLGSWRNKYDYRIESLRGIEPH